MFWALHAEDARGWAIMLTILAAIAALAVSYLRMFPPMTFLETLQGTVVSITEVPRPGNYANAASFWMVEVVLEDGETVEAESLYMSKLDSDLCLAKYDNGRWGLKYIVLGRVDIMNSRGVPCESFEPS